jgi:hypothetical protein
MTKYAKNRLQQFNDYIFDVEQQTKLLEKEEKQLENHIKCKTEELICEHIDSFDNIITVNEALIKKEIAPKQYHISFDIPLDENGNVITNGSKAHTLDRHTFELSVTKGCDISDSDKTKVMKKYNRDENLYDFLYQIRITQDDKKNGLAKLFEIDFINNKKLSMKSIIKPEWKFDTHIGLTVNDAEIPDRCGLNFAFEIAKTIEKIEECVIDGAFQELAHLGTENKNKLNSIRTENQPFETEQLLKDEKIMDALENREFDDRY